MTRAGNDTEYREAPTAVTIVDPEGGLMVGWPDPVLNLIITDLRLLVSPDELARAAFERGDYDEAFRLLRSLAEEADALAQYYLGQLYLKGNGVQQNSRQAYVWFRLAALNGNQNSNVNQLAERMTESELDEAETLYVAASGNWTPLHDAARRGAQPTQRYAE